MSKKQTELLWEKISLAVLTLAFLGVLLLLIAIALKNSGEVSLYLWWFSILLFISSIVCTIFSNKGHRRTAILGAIISVILAAAALFTRFNYWLGGITW